MQSHRSMTWIVCTFYCMTITWKQAVEQESTQLSQLTAQSTPHKVKLLLLIQGDLAGFFLQNDIVLRGKAHLQLRTVYCLSPDLRSRRGVFQSHKFRGDSKFTFFISWVRDFFFPNMPHALTLSSVHCTNFSLEQVLQIRKKKNILASQCGSLL